MSEGGHPGARVGTRERKRRERAEPDSSGTYRGCVIAVAVYLGICALWFKVAPGPWPIALAIPGLLVVGVALLHFIQGRILLGRVWVAWAPRGIRCLVVHSDSELWRERIASGWLPRIGARAVTMNWSQRSERRGSLEFQVFVHFCKSELNFNPAVIVFRGLRQPLVFRFYYAFRETRKGHPEYLERMESRMFESLGV